MMKVKEKEIGSPRIDPKTRLVENLTIEIRILGRKFVGRQWLVVFPCGSRLWN